VSCLLSFDVADVRGGLRVVRTHTHTRHTHTHSRPHFDTHTYGDTHERKDDRMKDTKKGGNRGVNRKKRIKEEGSLFRLNYGHFHPHHPWDTHYQFSIKSLPSKDAGLLQVIGLFESLLQSSLAKETYNCKELTNRSHPISFFNKNSTLKG